MVGSGPKDQAVSRQRRQISPIHSPEEQALLLGDCPTTLARMALFKVNTGLREKEVCGLKWDYEVKVPRLNASVFVFRDSRREH